MKKLIALLLITVLAVGALSGCAKKSTAPETAETESQVKVTEVTETETESETETETETAAMPEDDTARQFIVYFSGIDVWGHWSIQSRSDVNILMAVNRDTGEIQMVNTPRDYYVPMPVSGGARDKLTHAGLYGVENSKGALEELYGVKVDYYFRLNFSGFEKIIDSMGGIDVYSEFDFTVDPIKHYTEGMNHLTGLESLAFVRERKSFNAGDNQRGKNQMAMMTALIEKVSSPEFIKSYPAFMEAIDDFYETDIPMELLASMALERMAGGPEWKIETYAVTGSNGSEVTYSIPGTYVYVMIPDEAQVAEAGQLLNAVVGRENE